MICVICVICVIRVIRVMPVGPGPRIGVRGRLRIGVRGKLCSGMIPVCTGTGSPLPGIG